MTVFLGLSGKSVMVLSVYDVDVDFVVVCVIQSEGQRWAAETIKTVQAWIFAPFIFSLSITFLMLNIPRLRPCGTLGCPK